MDKDHAPLPREQRLAEKLRENLRRRKAQARAMAGQGEGAAPGKATLPKDPASG